MRKKLINQYGFKEKIIYYGSLIVLGVAVIMLFFFIYWTSSSTTVLKINNNPIPVEKKNIESGDIQIVDINYCKSESIRGNVVWGLESSRSIIVLPPYQDTNIAGCYTKLRAPIILPFVTHTDMYRFYWDVTYQINPIKTSTIQFTSKKFTIIEKDPN